VESLSVADERHEILPLPDPYAAVTALAAASMASTA
jgi:hypothetical protein